VVCRPDGRSDFDALRSQRRAQDATLVAFDLIELQGDDLRNDKLLLTRKQRLPNLLSRTEPLSEAVQRSLRDISAQKPVVD